MNNRLQALGVGFQLGNERQDTGFAGEVGKQGNGAALAKGTHAWPLSALTDDDRITFLQQSQCAMQANALAGAGYQDRDRERVI